MKTTLIIVLTLISCGSSILHADVVFGRLYTTPGQRAQLDEARSKLPKDGIKIEIVDTSFLETDSEQVQPDTSQSISLDGIVYRSDGKNTAWINRNSSNEGNLETQFTKVGEKDVRANQVKITLPDNETRIDLKVGQKYDVNTKEIHDMATEPATTGTPTGRAR